MRVVFTLDRQFCLSLSTIARWSRYREAYIDANEAINLNNMPRESGRMGKHWVRATFLCKATALQFLGFYKQASVDYEIALRTMDSEDVDYRNLCEDMVGILRDKVRQ